jgi:Protease subunit of ATP-dependent Clp proteases
MTEQKKYYSLVQNEDTAEIVIYGDITSSIWKESNVSAYNLSKQIAELDVSQIDVFINSYGGEVAEGLAIYNSLKRHKAKITTYCDGFACSIASVVFMAGDERIMSEASLLMIHNAWTLTAGNANELRKEADDLDTITEASISAYLSSINIKRDELKELLDGETWLNPQDSLDKGFATKVTSAKEESNPAQSAKKVMVERLTQDIRVGVAKEELNIGEIVENAVTKAFEARTQTVNLEIDGKAISKVVKSSAKDMGNEPTAEKNNVMEFFK